jgi:hypothetical protein
MDLFEEIKEQREKGTKELVKISKLWHNSFDDLLKIDQDPNSFLNNSLLTLNLRQPRQC